VWTAAAIGVACGAGAYAIAGITTLIVLVVLFGLGLIKTRMGLDSRPPPDDRIENPAVPDEIGKSPDR
jgi:uncharacterized membrane protein YhiD involved in acid resistance